MDIRLRKKIFYFIFVEILLSQDLALKRLVVHKYNYFTYDMFSIYMQQINFAGLAKCIMIAENDWKV